MRKNNYISQFANLNTLVLKGVKQPNKAILLLSLMELIRCGYIVDNKVPLEDTIKKAFDSTWRLYFNSEPPNVWTPFWHLRTESFWHFMSKYSMDRVERLVPPGETATIGKMKEVIKYAYFDENLFYLMQDKNSREILAMTLLNNYIITSM